MTFTKPALLLLIIATLVTTGCKKSSSSGSGGSTDSTGTGTGSTLSIQSINPTSGPEGTGITVTGTDFGTTAANDSFFVNGHYAALGTLTATTATIQVPVRAGTGAVTVKVGGAGATGPVFTYQYTIASSVFAGNGNINQVNGQGKAASFLYPSGIAMDASGNLFVAESGSGAIRTISPSATVGILPVYAEATIDILSGAANFVEGDIIGLSLDSTTDILWVGSAWDKVLSISTPETAAVEGQLPVGGAQMISQYYGPIGLAAAKGMLYILDYETNDLQVIAKNGDQQSSNVVTGFNGPAAIAIDDSSNLYIANTAGNNILKSTSGGSFTVLAGSGAAGKADGTGTAASFNGPQGIAVDHAGNVYVADSYNQAVRMITPAGVVTTFPGQYSYPCGIVTDLAGDTLFVTDAVGCVVYKITIQ
jgi:sugar lactone lactonase YvrE